ncbi:Eco29kI family restriction endonuclease [Kitasatospora sp. NPDC088160]|uniref:Eco29kI family restriction endonuclease n=1 Tax=Kitasatospora sp. NPDC088160 TaxID=3364072 RepID=UPI00381CF807
MTTPPERWPSKPRKPRNWRAHALTPKPYNPLDLENLGRSVERELLKHDPEPLDSIKIMMGAGVYALYYTGSHPLYQAISGTETPIYVGQARPEGTRKGNVDPSKVSCPLWDRLGEHRMSIEQVEDLDVADFKVRYLVAIEAFVSLAERVMIMDARPVWNSVVDGFGNHDPGADRRRTGKRPPWDELHPGRWWSHPHHMPTPSLIPPEQSRQRIVAHLAGEVVPLILDEIEPEGDGTAGAVESGG